MAIDNRLQVFNEEGQSVDYDILASDVKFLPDGKDLPTKLAEMEAQIEGAGQGDGTVTGVKVGSTTHEPTEGVVDLSEPFNDKVDKETGKELIPSTDLAKLQSLPTADQLTQQLGNKANSSDLANYATKSELGGKQDKLTNSTTLMTINGDGVHFGESVTIQGEKGEQGETGHVQVDGNGNVLIYNGLDKTTTGAALDASQGQFIGKILNAKDNTFYNVWVGSANDLELLDGDYEDNTIYLVGTIATAAQRFNVSFNGGDHTSIPSNTPQTAKEGSAFSVVVSPASGYTIDTATGTMAGGGTLTKTENQDGTVTFSTTSVTGVISITASASVHVGTVTIAVGTRQENSNSIPLTASTSNVLSNPTYAWSLPPGESKFEISGSGASVNLVVKSGAAANDSTTVTCAVTNSEQTDTQSASQPVTIAEGYHNIVPITALGTVSYAAGQVANTYQFAVETTPAGGNTPAIVWSVVPTPAGAATIDANTGLLTVTEDCSVVVTATCGSLTASSSSIALTYARTGVMPFADDEGGERGLIHKIMNKAVNGNEDTDVTYEDAAVYTPSLTTYFGGVYTTANSLFNGKDVSQIKSFDEWQYFPHVYNLRVDGWSNLESLTPPSTARYGKDTTLQAEEGVSRMTTTKIRKFTIPTASKIIGTKASADAATINSNSLMRLIYPSDITDVFAFVVCPYVQFHDLTKQTAGLVPSFTSALTAKFSGSSNARFIIKLPSSVTTLGQNSSAPQWTRNINNRQLWVEVGDSVNNSAVDKIGFSNYQGGYVNVILHQSTKPTLDIGNAGSKVKIYHLGENWSDMPTGVSQDSISNLPVDWDKCKITLTNATASNAATYVELDSSYNATITPGTGYSLADIKVRMCDVDITEEVFNATTGEVSIAEVWGDIVIKAEQTT